MPQLPVFNFSIINPLMLLALATIFCISQFHALACFLNIRLLKKQIHSELSSGILDYNEVRPIEALFRLKLAWCAVVCIPMWVHIFYLSVSSIKLAKWLAHWSYWGDLMWQIQRGNVCFIYRREWHIVTRASHH